MSEIEKAAALLRAAGWAVLPPPPETIPEPQAGQVWISPRPRVEPRTVVKVGPSRGWPHPSCVFFTTPSRPAHPQRGPTYLHPDSWQAWARKSGARPA